MNQNDIALITQVLKGKNQPLPIPGSVEIKDGKLYMEVAGRAQVQGQGVINTLLAAGLRCVVDGKAGTDENRAYDDQGIVHIWFLLEDVSEIWRK